jgi:hypothetical protein
VSGEWLFIAALLSLWVILSGNEDCRRNEEEWEEYWRWREQEEKRL